MPKKGNDAIVQVLFGVSMIIIGLFAIIQQAGFIMQVFHLLGWIMILHGLFNLYEHFIKRKLNQLDIPLVISNIIGGAFLILYTNFPLYLAIVFFAIYISLHGIVRFIVYITYRKDRVQGRLKVLVISLTLIFNGIVIMLSPSIHADDVVRIIGLYACLLGIRYINEGIFMVIPRKKKNVLKRKIRINLPAFLTVLIPKRMMEYINERLAVENNRVIEESDKEINLEIFIHVTAKGFGTMGHCDIYFDGEVLSYGNYDYSSIRLFEAMGDGVLFTTTKESYLPFCIAEDKKTIFGYGFHLTNAQVESIRQAIAKMKSGCYPWYPPGYYNPTVTSDYASRLYLTTNANFYKFDKGKFKTYFVLGSNCVLLAEEIVGRTGQDVININGIISPGTYQDYLEKEYNRPGSQVLTKNIYNKYTIVHK